jgi:GH15 family glucan-1,4-alpha-glucosidase
VAHGEAHAVAGDEAPLTLVTDLPLEIDSRRAGGLVELDEGESMFAALSWAGRRAPRSFPEATERIERTVAYWRRWLADGRFPDHP